MRDYLKGKRCMVWSFMGNSRMYQALRDYGDRLDTVGIFTFEVSASGTISETGTSISSMMTYINRWPHIHWLLTIMNHGTASIFTALRNNTGGAKDTFLSEIVRIMEKYPWCAGIDIDFCYDTGDLRFDLDLVAGLDLSGKQGRTFDAACRRRYKGIDRIMFL